MGPLGVPEMIFIFVLALLIFGPKKLPELGRSLGKGIQEFRRASNELKYTFEREMQNMERETESLKEAPSDHAAYVPPPDEYPYSYPSTSSESAPQAAESKPATPAEGSEAKHS